MRSTHTTVVRPPDPALHAALRLALAFASGKLLLHVLTTLWQAHHGWGYFRDEFYYVACGRHLAWGFVDHGPLVALQARIAETLFGHSLLGLRLPAALAGAARVFLTGLLCFQLGGRRSAQALSMLCVLVAPQYLGVDSFLSMNSFESLFWMSTLAALLLLQHRLGLLPSSPAAPSPSAPTTPRTLGPWLLVGLAAGLGLLNKPSMLFFLLALLAALLLTRTGRALLLRREALAGIALLLVLVAPYLHWQIAHGWPTLEFLENGRRGGKNTVLPPLAFLGQQVQIMNPFTAFLWLPGLVLLLRRPAFRWLGLASLLFFVLMLALHAKDYYVTPIYPILFAAGGLAWQQHTWRPFGRLSRRPSPDRLVGFPLYQATLVLTGLLLLPLAIPVLSPQAWIRYTTATHLGGGVSDAETSATGPLPQFFADRFGWQEEANQVSRIVASLPPADRARLTIRGDNYGDAASLQFLLPHLPAPVVSGHNTFWLWGPGPRPGDLLLDITADSPEHLHRFFQSVTEVGTMNTSRFQMPHERRKRILLLRDPVSPADTLPALWPHEKSFF